MAITIKLSPVLSQLSADGTVVVCTLLSCFAWVAVLLRIYTRTWIVGKTSWDDYLIVISVLLFTIFCILMSVEFQIGAGKSNVDGNFMATSTNLLLAIETFYIVTMGIFKISLGLFFLRIIINRILRLITICGLVVISVYATVYFFFAVFQCGIPKGSHFWIQKISTQCFSPTVTLGLGYVHATLMASSDLWFLCLVFPIILPTRLRFREKINVTLLLCLGTL
jgi:hypothetical protein